MMIMTMMMIRWFDDSMIRWFDDDVWSLKMYYRIGTSRQAHMGPCHTTCIKESELTISQFLVSSGGPIQTESQTPEPEPPCTGCVLYVPCGRSSRRSQLSCQLLRRQESQGKGSLVWLGVVNRSIGQNRSCGQLIDTTSQCVILLGYVGKCRSAAMLVINITYGSCNWCFGTSGQPF